MLEHFYLNNLNSAGGDRYIGCGKPSCYCCEMYMQFHPARTRARPYHANAWAQWSPPVAINEGPTTHTRHSLAILCRMLNRLHHDIRIHIYHVHLLENAGSIRRQGSHSQYGLTIDCRGTVTRQGGCYLTTLPSTVQRRYKSKGNQWTRFRTMPFSNHLHIGYAYALAHLTRLVRVTSLAERRF